MGLCTRFELFSSFPFYTSHCFRTAVFHLTTYCISPMYPHRQRTNINILQAIYGRDTRLPLAIRPRPDDLSDLLPRELRPTSNFDHHLFPFAVRQRPKRGVHNPLPHLALRPDDPARLEERPPRCLRTGGAPHKSLAARLDPQLALSEDAPPLVRSDPCAAAIHNRAL